MWHARWSARTFGIGSSIADTPRERKRSPPQLAAGSIEALYLELRTRSSKFPRDTVRGGFDRVPLLRVAHEIAKVPTRHPFAAVRSSASTLVCARDRRSLRTIDTPPSISVKCMETRNGRGCRIAPRIRQRSREKWPLNRHRIPGQKSGRRIPLSRRPGQVRRGNALLITGAGFRCGRFSFRFAGRSCSAAGAALNTTRARAWDRGHG